MTEQNKVYKIYSFESLGDSVLCINYKNKGIISRTSQRAPIMLHEFKSGTTAKGGSIN